MYDEYAFRWTCNSGNIEIIEFLLYIKPDINISVNNECAFRWVY